MYSLCLRTISSERVSVNFGVVVIRTIHFPSSRFCSPCVSVRGISGASCGLSTRDIAVGFGAAVAVELPRGADLRDFFEVDVVDEYLVIVATGLRNDFAARIAEVALAVKFANIPWSFFAYTVDCADEVAVGGGVRGLF